MLLYFYFKKKNHFLEIYYQTAVGVSMRGAQLPFYLRFGSGGRLKRRESYIK
jgi:hypothetical protein